jgi:hypothetical protein
LTKPKHGRRADPHTRFGEVRKVLSEQGYLTAPRGIWRPHAGLWWHRGAPDCPGHADLAEADAADCPAPDPPPPRPGLDDRLRELGVDPDAWRNWHGGRLLS